MLFHSSPFLRVFVYFRNNYRVTKVKENEKLHRIYLIYVPKISLKKKRKNWHTQNRLLLIYLFCKWVRTEFLFLWIFQSFDLFDSSEFIVLLHTSHFTLISFILNIHIKWMIDHNFESEYFFMDIFILKLTSTVYARYKKKKIIDFDLKHALELRIPI